MGPFKPIFGNFDENQTRRKQISDISLESLQAGKFENVICSRNIQIASSKEAIMNFAKYIAAHILTKFKYLANQIIFLNSLAHKV